MFRPKSMSKVRLIVLKTHIGSLVKDLHEAGLVDIRKSEYKGLDEGRPLASFDALSAELLKLRALVAMMESSLGKRMDAAPVVIEGAKAIAEARGLVVESELRRLNSEMTALSERIKSLEGEALAVEKVLHFKGVDFAKLKTRTLDFRVGEMGAAKLARLNESLGKLGGHNTMISESGYNVALVIFDRKSQQDVDSLLGEMGFIDIDLPEGMTSPMEAISRINAENDSAKARLKGTKAQMVELSKANIGHVSSLIRSLEVETERSGVASKFSSSKCAYVVEGWMLEEDMDVLRQIAEKYPEAILEDVKYGHHEMPPTVLDNPKVASPFEFLTSSYSMPNYFEIDPTMAYFIGLPILYGMIVGDVLYGVISLVLSLWLMKKFEKSYMMFNVSKIWLYSAFPTILFGLAFDEWAGMSHYRLLEMIGKWTGMTLVSGPIYTALLHRLENVLVLLGVTILVGMVHLAIGFMLGAINEWNHSKKHAIAKIAWLGIETGMMLVALPAIGLADQAFMMAGGAVLVLSVMALAFTEGVIGIIEIPGLIGNILSYTRIAVIGIVGVILAEILNDFLMPLPENGIMALVLIPVFVVLHIANCFLAMFESLIQGGRLNIVEFKMKFMQGGGGVFTPFALYSKKY
jgi:V/A-type H+/Na+-transporting ATPase subunit I